MLTCALMHAGVGLTPPRPGQVMWDGKDLAGEKTHTIIATGIARVPEGRKMFPRMTVDGNRVLGAVLETDASRMRERQGKV